MINVDVNINTTRNASGSKFPMIWRSKTTKNMIAG